MTLDAEIKKYEEAVKKNPDDHMAHYSLGVAYGIAGHFDEAIAVWRKIENDPNFEGVKWHIKMAETGKSYYLSHAEKTSFKDEPLNKPSIDSDSPITDFIAADFTDELQETSDPRDKMKNLIIYNKGENGTIISEAYRGDSSLESILQDYPNFPLFLNAIEGYRGSNLELYLFGFAQEEKKKIRESNPSLKLAGKIKSTLIGAMLMLDEYVRMYKGINNMEKDERFGFWDIAWLIGAPLTYAYYFFRFKHYIDAARWVGYGLMKDFDKAKWLKDHQKYDKALAKFDDFIRKNPNDKKVAEAHIHKGDVYLLSSGRVIEENNAVEEYANALATDPKYALLVFCKVGSRASTSKYRAMLKLNNRLRDFPDNPPIVDFRQLATTWLEENKNNISDFYAHCNKPNSERKLRNRIKRMKGIDKLTILKLRFEEFLEKIENNPSDAWLDDELLDNYKKIIS